MVAFNSQGVSGAIKKRAGYALFCELAKKGAIALGYAVLTGAGSESFSQEKSLKLMQNTFSQIELSAQVIIV